MPWFFAGISLAATGVCVAVASVVLLRDQKNRLNRVFAVLCISVAYWSFVQFQSRQAPDALTAAFWIKASAPWPLAEALLLHFILVFTERAKLLAGKLTYVLIYLPAVIIALIDLSTNWITGTPVKVAWGWTSIRPGTAMNVIGDLYVIIWTFAALYLAFEYYRTQEDARLRQRAFWVLAGISIPIVAGITTDVLLPQFFPSPEFGPASAALGIAFCAGYAMWRYELFSITPARAADKILSTMSDSLLLTDPDGRILTANRAAQELLSTRPNGPLYANIDDILVGTTFRDLLERPVGEASARQTGETETTLRTRAGDIPVSLAWSTMAASDGSPMGVVWIARDISERRQIDRLRSDLIATVSHELRNPLAVIIGSAGMLERLYETGRHESCLHAIRRINKRSQEMGQLVEGLLDMRRIEMGDFSPQLEDVDLGGLVRGEADALLLSDAHELVIDVSTPMPAVCCDRQRISAAIGNLLRNAVKFSPDGGRIEVRVWHRDSIAHIVVKDQGIGISPADRERVFERFVQADMSSTRSFGGTGIGLYLVREIMKAHGGRVSIESEPGKGSSFSLELPVLGPAGSHLDIGNSGAGITNIKM